MRKLNLGFSDCLQHSPAMLSYKAMVDHRIIGCDLHSRDFGYDREAGDQPLGGQNGELEMLKCSFYCYQAPATCVRRMGVFLTRLF